MVGGEEPEWRKVRDAGTAIFAQTKDLRAAVILVRSLLALNGLPGLGEGMQLVGRLCEQYWDTVHPVLDADEGDDPIERLNALANLDDADRPDPIRCAPARIVESREAGSYTVSDLDIVAGRIAAAEGTQAPTKGLLEVAWRTGDPEATLRRRAAVEDCAGRHATRLIKLFRDKTNDAPSIDTLRQTTEAPGQGLLRRGRPTTAVPTTMLVMAKAAVGRLDDGAIAGGGAKAGGALGSRADAIKILEQVAAVRAQDRAQQPGADVH